MEFNSLLVGNQFYVLRKSGHTKLLIGTIKAKTQSTPPYNTTPNLFNNNFQSCVNLTVSINDVDEYFNNIPSNIEIAERGNDIFSGSRDAILSAANDKLTANKKEIELYDFRKEEQTELESIIEILNPRYKEEKNRDKTISDLQQRQQDTDKKLDEALSILKELISKKTS